MGTTAINLPASESEIQLSTPPLFEAEAALQGMGFLRKAVDAPSVAEVKDLIAEELLNYHMMRKIELKKRDDTIILFNPKVHKGLTLEETNVIPFARKSKGGSSPPSEPKDPWLLALPVGTVFTYGFSHETVRAVHFGQITNKTAKSVQMCTFEENPSGLQEEGTYHKTWVNPWRMCADTYLHEIIGIVPQEQEEDDE